MEAVNSMLITRKAPQEERMTELSKMAKQQLNALSNIDSKLLPMGNDN